MAARYRTDQVGSLLWPQELLAARADYKAGRPNLDDLRRLEDRIILAALDIQREVGIDVFTNGEMRRDSWQSELGAAVEGSLKNASCFGGVTPTAGSRRSRVTSRSSMTSGASANVEGLGPSGRRAVAAIRGVLSGLEVHPARMRRHLVESTVAERLAFRLAEKHGRGESRDLVADAVATGKPPREALADRLEAEELGALLDGTTSLGSAEEFVDRALARYDNER